MKAAALEIIYFINSFYLMAFRKVRLFILADFNIGYVVLRPLAGKNMLTYELQGVMFINGEETEITKKRTGPVVAYLDTSGSMQMVLCYSVFIGWVNRRKSRFPFGGNMVLSARKNAENGLFIFFQKSSKIPWGEIDAFGEIWGRNLRFFFGKKKSYFLLKKPLEVAYLLEKIPVNFR